MFRQQRARMFVERVRRGPGEQLLQPKHERHAEKQRPRDHAAPGVEHGSQRSTPRAARHAVDEDQQQATHCRAQAGQRGEKIRVKKRGGVEHPGDDGEDGGSARHEAAAQPEPGMFHGSRVQRRFQRRGHARALPPFAGWRARRVARRPRRRAGCAGARGCRRRWPSGHSRPRWICRGTSRRSRW